MDIWTWAQEAYARPGVAPACLALQDEHGQNVSYLLWAAWSGAREPELLRRAAEIALGWDAAGLLALRQARRGMKAPVEGVPDGPRQALREQVKACELAAERVLLEALASLGVGDKGSAVEALTAASAAWTRPAPAHALAALAAALE